MSGSWAEPCPHPRPGGHRCKSRRCPACGVLWAGDTRRRLLANVTAYNGPVALLAVTAPGKDVLPNQAAMWRWNTTAPARWRAMHRAAAQIARRRHGKLSVLAWTWEYQRRGALHKHPVLGMATPRERAAAHTYALALDQLRHVYGFGFISDTSKSGAWRRKGLQEIAADRAGRYVAKYLSPLDRSTGKPTLSETVTRPDVPPLVAYVSRSLTMKTGVTMRYLRWVRLAYVLGVNPDTGEVLAPAGALDLHEELPHEACAPTRGP